MQELIIIYTLSYWLPINQDEQVSLTGTGLLLQNFF